MASEWRTATVAELQRERVLLVEDGNHGENRPRPDEFVANGVVFVRAADMDAGRVLFDSASRINERARRRISKGIGSGGDVLLSHKGTVGKVALVPEDAPPFVCSPQTTFWRALDPDVLDRQYLHAFLRSPAFHRQLATRAGETDMAPYVSLTSQRGLSVTLPPIGVQRAVAHILGALDEKIELNRRMSQTLKEIAEARFRSWFVDFDPVRAKAEGRDPGLRGHLADPFRDSFEDSELGEIPVGWSCAPLAEHVETIRGLSYSGAGLSDDGLPLHNLNSIYERGGYKREGIKRYRGTFEERHLAQAGDLIVANTEQGHERLLLGYAGIVPPFPDERMIFSHHLYRVRPRQTSPLTADYLCHLLNSRRMHDVVSGYSNGTTVNMLPMDALSRPFVIVPPKQLIDEFDRFARLVRERDDVARAENASLAALRDALIPKLISGELRVESRRGETDAGV